MDGEPALVYRLYGHRQREIDRESSTPSKKKTISREIKKKNPIDGVCNKSLKKRHLSCLAHARRSISVMNLIPCVKFFITLKRVSIK